MTGRDWYAWHAGYDDPDSGLSRRLSWARDRIRAALDEAPPGPVRLISLCAGQGRDVLGVLPAHRRRDDVSARLVELDPRNTAVAERLSREARLRNVEIVTGDASRASAYAGMVPADVVLACGLFGNMTDAGIERTMGTAHSCARPVARSCGPADAGRVARPAWCRRYARGSRNADSTACEYRARSTGNAAARTALPVRPPRWNQAPPCSLSPATEQPGNDPLSSRACRGQGEIG